MKHKRSILGSVQAYNDSESHGLRLKVSEDGFDQKSNCLEQWFAKGYVERVLTMQDLEVWRLVELGLDVLGARSLASTPQKALRIRDVPKNEYIVWELLLVC